MKNFLLSCLLLEALGCASVIHIPADPALNTTVFTFLDPLSTTTKNVSVPLNPTRYPASPPFRFDVTTLRYRPLDVADVFCHILGDILLLWLQPNEQILQSFQLVDPRDRSIRTFINPPYIAHQRMDVRTLAYVFIALNKLLLEHEVAAGFAQWVRVIEAGSSEDKNPLLLNIYIVPTFQLKGPVSNFTNHSNTTMTLPSNRSTSNPANAMVVDVVYTGTALSRGDIFRLATRTFNMIITHDAASPCPQGSREIFTQDGKVRMLLHFTEPQRHGVDCLLVDLALGILDLLYLYARQNRWESNKATITYNEAMLVTLVIEAVPPRVDEPRDGGNDGWGENGTATS